MQRMTVACVACKLKQEVADADEAMEFAKEHLHHRSGGGIHLHSDKKSKRSKLKEITMKIKGFK